MNDLTELTADQLAEKVQSALPVSDLVSGEGVLALAELVRRASERDRAKESHDKAWQNVGDMKLALAECIVRAESAEAERDQAVNTAMAERIRMRTAEAEARRLRDAGR